MSRPKLALILAFGAAFLLSCREPLDFDRAFTADPERGRTLVKQNCANACHPADAFTRKGHKVKNFNQLAYAVRDYYEAIVGDETNYSQQDVFDMAKYLNRTYYHYYSSF